MENKMSSNIEKYKSELQHLVKSGEEILDNLIDNAALTKYRQEYEIWYSESHAIIKLLLPDRISDFSKIYYLEKSKDCLKSLFQYLLSDDDYLSLNNFGPQKFEIAQSLLDTQVGILKSCLKRFESSLFDIKQLIQADLFDSELEVAGELNKKGFTRGAGAVAGVVLEGHLNQICTNHQLKIKKNASINDLNQLLKDNNIIDIPTWRYILRLGDLRNLCDHKKIIEPSKEDIDELIGGVDKITKTLF